jgi:hypothetical protein
MPTGIYVRTEWHKSRCGFKKGHKSYLTEESKKKIGKSHIGVSSGMLGKTGENCPNWKGDSAGKHAIHRWVEKNKGRPKKCGICGIEGNKIYDWANKDHRYRRVLDDYIRLCRACHQKYDRENNNWERGKTNNL